jgi:hypothetical protein
MDSMGDLMKPHPYPDEQVQRLQLELLQSYFNTITPHPVSVCLRLLATISRDRPKDLAFTALKLFAGFTDTEIDQAEWRHLILEEGVIWDPQRLTWRPLHGARAWFQLIWWHGATGKIFHGCGARMTGLVVELRARPVVPRKYQRVSLEDTHRAYCFYPDAFPPLVQTDPVLWKKLQVYRRRGIQLQQLSPRVVYNLTKPPLTASSAGLTTALLTTSLDPAANGASSRKSANE